MKKIKQISSGGYSGRGGHLSQILEFNIENRSWTVIGAMKEERNGCAVSVISFDDYEKWCN